MVMVEVMGNEDSVVAKRSYTCTCLSKPGCDK